MLYELYGTLCAKIPQDGVELLGLPLEEQPTMWFSIDQEAHPALMLPAQSNDVRPNIVLRSIEVAFSRDCEIRTTEGDAHFGCYSIIQLREDDPDVVRLFSKILEERFCRDQTPRNNAEIAQNIHELAALFRKTESSNRDLIGLWGELNVILRSENLEVAVSAWSKRKDAKYDFVTDSFVLDVKTTLSAIPKHRFALEQVRPKGDFDAYVVSSCLVEVQSGQTVGSLMDTISSRITDSDARNSFLNQCVQKGGTDIYRDDLKLQTYPDADALNLYFAREIPAPVIGKNELISNVRFDVDLSEIEPLPQEVRRRVLRFTNQN